MVDPIDNAYVLTAVKDKTRYRAPLDLAGGVLPHRHRPHSDASLMAVMPEAT
jgi:hypothetical protein